MAKLQKKDIKLLVTAGCILVFLLAMLVVINLLKRDEGKVDENESVSMEITEGQTVDLIDSKTASYTTGEDIGTKSKGSADDLWQSLTSDKVSEKEDTLSKTSSTRKVVNDIISGLDKTGQASGGSGKQPEPEPAPRRSVISKPEPEPEPVAAPEPETVRVEVPVVEKVRRETDVDGWGGDAIFSLDGEAVVLENTTAPVRVMFTRNEKIKQGQRVILRLLDDIVVEGVKLDANTHLTAICGIGQGRLTVEVTGFTLNGKIYSTALVGYDSDGLEGIYCPAAESEEVKQSAKSTGVGEISSILGSAIGSALGGSTLGSAVGNLSRSAVQVGASAVTSSSNKVTVTVPSGYMFYLVQVKN